MELKRFPLWRALRFAALCAAIVYFFTLTTIDSGVSRLDRHQSAVATLVDLIARLALIGAIAFAPSILEWGKADESQKVLHVSVVELLVTVMFLGIVGLLAMCQMMRVGIR